MKIYLGDTNKFFGMCLKNYLTDTKGAKPNVFVGKQLKVRIISNTESTILVTIRDSIINDKLPIINSVESIKVGMATLGVITKITETGCYVTFYQVKNFINIYFSLINIFSLKRIMFIL